MTPAQKAALRQQLERASVAYAALTADQKATILGQMADTIDRMKSLTPAQRESMKSLYRRLIGA